MSMTVKGFKLTSNEEIIAELREATPVGFSIENPVALEWEIHPSTEISYDLFPWVYASKLAQPMHLNVFAVASGPFDITASVQQNYRQYVDRILNIQEQKELAFRHQKMTTETRRRRGGKLHGTS